jgi:hypothetical protein
MTAERVVLDTNVVVSAALQSHGTTSRSRPDPGGAYSDA